MSTSRKGTYRSRFGLGSMAVLFAMAAGLSLQCSKSKSLPTNSSTVQMQADEQAAESTAAVLASTLTPGVSTPDTLGSMAAELQSDPTVLAAMVSDDGQSLYVKYKSGMAHVFWVRPSDSGDVTDPAPSFAVRKVADLAARRTLAGLFGMTTVMPPGRKALVAKGYPIGSTTAFVGTVASMLRFRGYDVTGPVDADIELFKTLNNYDVVYIETDGGLGVDLPVLANPDIPGDTGCPGGKEEILLTSTPVTLATLSKYGGESYCNALMPVSPITLSRTSSADLGETVWGVTPPFAIKWDTSTPTGPTLLCLPCAQIEMTQDLGDSTLVSNWSALYSRGWTLAWQVGRVPSFVGVRAGLTLMQLLLGSNYDMKWGDQQFLRGFNPPIVPQTLNEALNALGPASGGLGQYGPAVFMPDDMTKDTDLALVPSIRYLEIKAPGKALMEAVAPGDHPQLVVDGVAVDIGTPDDYGDYNFNLDKTLWGEAYLQSAGRTSTTRNLLAWSFAPTVNGTIGDPRVVYKVDYKIPLRAMIGGQGQITSGVRIGSDVWGPSTWYNFVAYPDPGTITWTVAGMVSDEFYTYTYYGSGSKQATFLFGGQPSGDVGFYTQDATTAEMDVEIEDPPTYTVTGQNRITGEIDQWEETVPTTAFNLVLSLGPGLNILPGIEQSSDASYTISWSRVSPDPAYDPSTSPR